MRARWYLLIVLGVHNFLVLEYSHMNVGHFDRLIFTIIPVFTGCLKMDEKILI